MPRRARIAVAGIPWHIIHRGNNRTACFFTAADYIYFLNTLSKQSVEWECEVHAYVLMTNHIHLLITPQYKESAAGLMKNFSQRYTQYVNRTYERTGTLWEGRFRSCLAQDEAYALTCQRYIELNPVRAGMVDDPSNYPWSSYRANSFGERNALLTPHADYLALGIDKTDRYRQYRSLFETAMGQETIADIRSATNGNYVLGDKKFQGEIEAMLGRRVTIGSVGRPRQD